LVDRRLTPRAVGSGIISALLVYAAFSISAAVQCPASLPWLILAPIFGLGYTTPPLRFCWRGLGELDVAFTHSALVLVFGYVLGGGRAATSWPWLISLPLFLAVFAAITLSGVPDAAADSAANKRSLVVRFGQDVALRLALLATLGAALAGVLVWAVALPASPLLVVLAAVMVASGVWQGWNLTRLARMPSTGGRIDRQMRGALAYIMWFVLVPLITIGSASHTG
jgi:1,4-dihydroxy-2-naphthoate octaprenyltransferase